MARAASGSTAPLILVGDDGEIVRDLVSDVLGHEGFRTVTAAERRAAVQLALTRPLSSRELIDTVDIVLHEGAG